MSDTEKGNIDSVSQLLKHLGHDAKFLNEPAGHLRAWFRGHADETWKLVPGVYRPGFLPVDSADEEDKRLELERQLIGDFHIMSAGIRRGDEGEAELYFLQQHYRMRTRLLDWTNNPLAALHFAVSTHLNRDGRLFLMDAHQLGPEDRVLSATGLADTTHYGRKFSGIADSRHPVFQEALHVIFCLWKRVVDFPDFIIPVRPDYFDRRITLQRGCFTFHVPKGRNLTRNENPTLSSYLIAKENKPRIARELAALGIDDFSIFGDLEHLSTSLKAAYGIKDY
jgi:hypothetical protein